MTNLAIIYLNYNSFGEVRRSFISLETQNYKDYKVLVIDNNSQDEQLLMQKWSSDNNVYFSKCPTNDGYAAGNNFGIRKARELGCDSFLILNPDIIIDDADFLTVLIKDFQSSSSDILGAVVKCYPEKGKIYFGGGTFNTLSGFTKIEGRKTNTLNFDGIKTTDFVAGSCMLLSEDCIKKYGFMPENYFLYFEETDYCLRVNKLGGRVNITSQTHVYHEGSTSIGYLSKTYLYYINKNYRIFAKKYLTYFNYIIFFNLFYYIIWIPYHIMLVIKNRQYKSIKYIFQAVFAKKLKD